MWFVQTQQKAPDDSSVLYCFRLGGIIIDEGEEKGGTEVDPSIRPRLEEIRQRLFFFVVGVVFRFSTARRRKKKKGELFSLRDNQARRKYYLRHLVREKRKDRVKE